MGLGYDRHGPIHGWSVPQLAENTAKTGKCFMQMILWTYLSLVNWYFEGLLLWGNSAIFCLLFEQSLSYVLERGNEFYLGHSILDIQTLCDLVVKDKDETTRKFRYSKFKTFAFGFFQTKDNKPCKCDYPNSLVSWLYSFHIMRKEIYMRHDMEIWL